MDIYIHNKNIYLDNYKIIRENYYYDIKILYKKKINKQIDDIL